MDNFYQNEYLAAAERKRTDSSEIKWNASAQTDSNPIIRLGFWSVGIMFGVFLIWGSMFDLSSAIITPGTLMSEGRNKTVQHSAGGRIRVINFSEGEMVQNGDVILELDTTQTQADLSKLQARYASLTALKSRLDLERSYGKQGLRDVEAQMNKEPGHSDKTVTHSISNSLLTLRDSSGNMVSTFVPPAKPKAEPVKKRRKTAVDELIQLTNTDPPPLPFDGNDELMSSQREAFLSGRSLLRQEVAGLRKKAETLSKQRNGIQARIDAQQALLKMATAEADRLRPLVEKGYVAKNRLNERDRVVLELTGAIQSLESDAIGLENQIGEIDLQIGKTRIESADVAYKEYTKIVGELAEIEDSLTAAQATVEAAKIRATGTGTLLRMTATTVGSIVGGGETIVEIVPEGAPLVVQARVLPGDIDYVQVGQDAEIAITAFNRRIDDTIQGRVVYKSADAERDEKTGDPYFNVRLELTGVSGKGRSRLGDLQAGMQSEVYIHTGSRTFLTYLAKPMIDSFRRAFRE